MVKYVIGASHSLLASIQDTVELILRRTEHMEEDEADSSFPHWIALEYAQMLKWAAPNQVIFSSLSPASVASLCPSPAPPSLPTFPSSDLAFSPHAAEQLLARGAQPDSFRAETKSVLELMQLEGVPLEKVCLLDPRAKGEIAPSDGNEYEWFLCVHILSPNLVVSTRLRG